MVALVGQGSVNPILQYTGGATSDSIPLRLTAGTQATTSGFTVYWWDINHNPAGSSVFPVRSSSRCQQNNLQPGEFLDFAIGPIVNSICQFYPDNTEGLMSCTTYRFRVQLNPPYDNVLSNNAFQSTACE